MAQYMKIENLTIHPRQRKSIPAASILTLADSIEQDGLIHPILVLLTELNHGRLVVGERRLRAIEKLHAENRPFTHASMPVTPGWIPITLITKGSLAQLLQLEFVENKERLNLEWPEEIAAIAAIEEARRADEPNLTQKQLAVEIQKQVGGSVNTHHRVVNQSLRLAELLPSRPDLLKARTSKEAMQIVLREQREAFEAEFAKRRLRKVTEDERLWSLQEGDARQLLLKQADASVDLILCDPPYGINIDKEKYAASQLHRYTDTKESALDLAIFIIQEGWRVTKRQANLFLFCDWKLYELLATACAQYGWTPWHRPIIWQKARAEGAAPWGKTGFINTYEHLLWATKGQLGIKGPIPDIIYIPKVAALSKTHGAEKPIDLLDKLIQISTNTGELILDPCAGSGSTLEAAVRAKRRCAGYELDPIYFNRAMTRMADLERDLSNERQANSRPSAPSSPPAGLDNPSADFDADGRHQPEEHDDGSAGSGGPKDPTSGPLSS